jgi:hypothetical protein
MNDAALKPPGMPRIVEIPLGRKPLCRLTYSEEDVRVSDEVRDWVGFMSVENEDGEAVYCGTVFVCLVYGSDRSRTFMYLVTAKHNVLSVGERDCSVWLNLMNDKEEPSMDCQPITIPAGAKWYFHPTEAHRTDVAVLPIQFLWQLRMPRPRTAFHQCCSLSAAESMDPLWRSSCRSLGSFASPARAQTPLTGAKNPKP